MSQIFGQREQIKGKVRHSHDVDEFALQIQTHIEKYGSFLQSKEYLTL